MSDVASEQKPPQKKTKKIVLTVMGAAAVGVVGLALLGGNEGEGEELRRNSYASKEDCIADYSAEQCEPQPQAAAGIPADGSTASGAAATGAGGSALAWIGPAYLAGRMMGGGGFGGQSSFGGQSGFAAGQPGAAGGPMPGQRREEEQRSGGGSGGLASSAGYNRPGAIANDPGPGRTQGTAAAVPRMAVSNVSRGGFGSTGRSFSSSSSS